MTRHRLVAAAALALLAAGCGRSNADKGMPSEQQRSDLDNMAAKIDNEQVVELPDDSLTVNEGEAQAALNKAAPGNAAAPTEPAPPVANATSRAARR